MAQTMAIVGFVSPRGVGYLFRVTTEDLQRWNGSSWTVIASSVFTGGVLDFFSFAGWGDEILMTNGKDKIYKYNTLTGAKGFIAQSFPAKHIQTFGGRVIASATVEGSFKPYNVRWCVKDNNEDWTGDGSGFEPLFSAPGGLVDEVQGVFPITDDTAFIIRTHSIWQMSLTGIVLTPFRFTLTIPGVGTTARRAIASAQGGYILIARDNVIFLSGGGGITAIGDQVRETLLPLIDDPVLAVAKHDYRRNELRIVYGKTVWRHNFRTPGWTKDEYPSLIRDIAFVKFGAGGITKIGLVIDDLVGVIDDLGTNYPPGKIDDLVTSTQFTIGPTGDGTFFIFYDDSTSLIAIEDPASVTDIDIDGNDVDSEIIAATGLLQAGSTLDKTKVVEAQLEYEAEAPQTLTFKYSNDRGVTWATYSTLDISPTTGPSIVAVRKTLPGHNIQLAVTSETLGKIRVLSFTPRIVKEAKVRP
jgi:hypothetical protein